MARPQEYNREKVLNSAITVFHQQGYGATSVPNLVEATGLQPGSLYAAFGNKKGLLIEALEFYSKQSLADMDHLLNEHTSALESLFGYLRKTSHQCQSEAGRRGCLVMNMLLELSAQDKEIDTLLQKLIDKTERRFVTQIERSITQKEIGAKQDPNALAKFVLTNTWGLRVLGRRNAPEDTDVVANQIISYLKGCTN